jgi:23S rRNA pseudouridine2605 synthase
MKTTPPRAPTPRPPGSIDVPEERLQRALARAGFGSRRACEELISAGRVTVNGTVATLGDKVDATSDEVRLNGTPVNLNPNVRYYALHKPAGVVTTMRDPQGRPDLRSLLPDDDETRVFPVGRLDLDSEGLLLLTNDGALADRLTHPRYGIEKEYLAEVEGSPTPKQLGLIRRGVELEDGQAKAKSARIVDARGGRGHLSLVMTEGRKREVRRLLAEVGLPVTRLVRVRVGSVTLGRMRPGAIRELSPDEVLALSRMVEKAERRLRRSPGASL